VRIRRTCGFAAVKAPTYRGAARTSLIPFPPRCRCTVSWQPASALQHLVTCRTGGFKSTNRFVTRLDQWLPAVASAVRDI